MRSLVKRNMALAAFLLPLLGAVTAQATGYPVIDVAGIGQVALQISKSVAQVALIKQQVKQMANATKLLRPQAYAGVYETLRGNLTNYQRVDRQMTQVGYSLQRVDRQFSQVFPNEARIAQMRPSDVEAITRNMSQELNRSALVAMEAQSNLAQIEHNSTIAARTLGESDGNQSQVAQLQLAVQMLALMDENLRSIIQVVSTSSRVTSNTAAAAVTERQMARRAHRIAMEGYGTPAVRSRGLHRTFLRGK